MTYQPQPIDGDRTYRSYLETVLLAAQFAAYDRGEMAKGGV